MYFLKEYRYKRHIKKFGSKNNGYFNYFNKEWFEKHQNTLIWLLNHRLLRYWFRWILRINKDCKGIINRIEPNAYWFDAKYINEKEIEVKTDFRTHNKFSKRIYYAFRPLWHLLHSLDWLIQKSVSPQFSFGFDTLTAYPDANPETTTVDGVVTRQSVDESWSLIRDGAGNGFTGIFTQIRITLSATTTTNQYSQLYRGFCLFDTSSILSTYTVLNSIFSLFGAYKYSDFGNLDIHSAGATTLSNTALANSDYANVGRTSFGSLTYSGFDTNGYNAIAENANGISAITKGGITKRSLQIANDINNSAPTWVSEGFYALYLVSADATGTSADPKLVVTYTLPATFVPQIMMI